MLKALFINEEGVKPWIPYAAVVIGILVGGYLVYAYWTESDDPADVTVMCVTEGCGYTRSRPIEVGERIPLECPDCGNRSVYPAFRCPKCGEPMVLNQSLGLDPPTKCRHCGAERQGR